MCNFLCATCFSLDDGACSSPVSCMEPDTKADSLSVKFSSGKRKAKRRSSEMQKSLPRRRRRMMVYLLFVLSNLFIFAVSNNVYFYRGNGRVRKDCQSQEGVDYYLIQIIPITCSYDIQFTSKLFENIYLRYIFMVCLQLCVFNELLYFMY